ncbi:hypothetical protein ARMSODRAFT_959547, partial [Armillaria solidipes]
MSLRFAWYLFLLLYVPLFPELTIGHLLMSRSVASLAFVYRCGVPAAFRRAGWDHSYTPNGQPL